MKGMELIQGTCPHCDQDIIAPEASFKETWDKHLDGCEGFKTYMKALTELHEGGLLQSAIKQVKIGQIEQSLKRLMKKHKISHEELTEVLRHI